MIFCLRHLDRRGARGYNERRQVNQQTVAIAFIGNAVRIRGSPLYCKDDERSLMSLSGTPDGKAGARMNPSQETSQRSLECTVFSAGKSGVLQRRALRAADMEFWKGPPAGEALFAVYRHSRAEIPDAGPGRPVCASGFVPRIHASTLSGRRPEPFRKGAQP